jgi:8-oxo-dGTP pyrophosphatase MutT (NUDIX family)
MAAVSDISISLLKANRLNSKSSIQLKDLAASLPCRLTSNNNLSPRPMQNKSIQKRKRYVPPESGPPKAATAIIIRSDGNFLSVLPHSAKNAKWEEPGGRIDAGETALQCAVRETREETGIDLTDASFRLIGWVYSKWPKANVYVFKTHTMPDVKVDNIEIAKWALVGRPFGRHSRLRCNDRTPPRLHLRTQ